MSIRRIPGKRLLRTRRGKVGSVILAFVVLVAVFGPLFAQHSPSAIVGPPAAGPSPSYPLGTDYLGHDVLSRVLYGGRTMLAVALLATAIAYAVGVAAGM